MVRPLGWGSGSTYLKVSSTSGSWTRRKSSADSDAAVARTGAVAGSALMNVAGTHSDRVPAPIAFRKFLLSTVYLKSPSYKSEGRGENGLQA